MANQRGHCGVEPVLQFQLDGKAFCKVAGEKASRFKTLQNCQDSIDLFLRCTKTLRDLGKIGAQIAHFVKIVRELHGDDAVGGIIKGKAHLFFDMIAQRNAGGGHLLYVEAFTAAGKIPVPG